LSPSLHSPWLLEALSSGLFAALCLVGCSPGSEGEDPERALFGPGDLLILDGDAGEVLPDGERAGALFVARALAAGGFAPPEVLASDPRWVEPTDLAVLDDGTVLVMESAWAPGPGPGRGALFRVRPGASTAQVSLWWTDERLRRPVSLIRHPSGTVYVSDRDANPLGLDQPTGSVFAVAQNGASAGALGQPGLAKVAAAGPELVTPGPLALGRDGAVLVMDADANPRGVLFDDGRPGTPGVLYRITPTGLAVELEPTRTVSPIGLVRGEGSELFVIDANQGQAHGVMGDGALFVRKAQGLELVVDSLLLGRPRAMVDPCGGDALADGRLVVADANADPLQLGEDGTGKGVYGTGPGAVLVIDPVWATVETLLADERFVMPLAVRRVRPWGASAP